MFPFILIFAVAVTAFAAGVLFAKKNIKKVTAVVDTTTKAVSVVNSTLK